MDLARARRDLAGALLLFFCSGVSGLVFEVIWVRALTLWVGHSSLAVSLVVAAFLAGLVFGSYLGGPWADRSARPLRLYATLELVVGASALGVSVLLSHLGHVTASGGVLDVLGVRMALSFILLLAPTAAMGATTPALARFVTKDIAHVGRAFALLYSVNTLGAALGCGLAGFEWLGRYGLFRTELLAVACNALVGGAALVWAARLPPSEPVEKAEPGRELEVATAEPGLGARGIHAVAFATGAASIACEVLWFRVLRTFVDSSTYAFTLLLVTFLLGLVVGGLVYAWRLSGHPRPWQLVADLQRMLAFAGLGSMALLGSCGALLDLLRPVVGPRSSIATQAVLVVVVIFVPTVLAGATYPLVMRLGSSALARLGRSVGTLAAANTVGGALASLVTGLWLIPLMGTQRGLALAFTVNLAVSMALARKSPAVAGEAAWRRWALWPAVFVAVTWVLLPADYILHALTYWAGAARVLAVREGRDGTAVVDGIDRASVCEASKNHCKDHCKTDFHYQQLTFGSMSYASTLPAGRRYMRALGHLPMLLRPNAARALEVCFGTGTTAATFATYARLESLTIVDINRDVFELARFFRESNHDILSDPRVHPVVEDGRHFLATAANEFDVVSLEPPPPEADGAASLYTIEFYELVKRRMRDGGVLAQWIPLQLQTEGLNRSLLRSITDVFPFVNLYIPSRVEAVILASERALSADVAQWDASMSAPLVQSSLAEVGLGAPEELLGTLVLDDAGVRRYVGDAAPVTDDLPAIEFFRSHPGAPYSLDHMLGLAVDPATLSPLEPTRAARLRQETAATRLQMASWMSALAKDEARALSLAEEAAQLVGETNVYARALLETDADCTGMEEP
jgi:predicted membrane-bound spermidine synthase